ncbi:serine/threonine protein kinase [Photorhabdus luminescens]|uniref:Protein kinase n=1 Tax=Photorhabdus heterorhabditis TaxID=880156 RepID=A0ABR5K9V6_9GAMM|nr:protein kinase [Photorhabdus heterorhabditis]KOY61190.1 protein kinase [Photorhabdus heterorhabditis]PQQ28215.1 serine/threonine protein kinase [Photorhabdus luminescens]PQQ31079.1 serine/threonine protein kinase [Photorhabdus luminescens]
MERRGNYFINPVRQIGRGAFGYVEEVELYSLDNNKCGNYARKTLSVNEDLLKGFTLDEWKRRFRREAMYQASCCHSNVAPIYIHQLSTDKPWFITGLAENDLNSELSMGLLRVSEKLSIIKMILEGIKYMHVRKRYLHRDLKPANILKFSDGFYKVSDFGLVKNSNKEAESEVLSHIGAAMGTRKYMAPEVHNGFYDEKTDIYALGVVIGEFGISQLKGIDDFIHKSTAHKPAMRYNSIEDMLSDFEKIIKENNQ